MLLPTLKRCRSDQDAFDRRVKRRNGPATEVKKVEHAADTNAWLRLCDDPWGLNPRDVKKVEHAADTNGWRLSDDPWGLNPRDVEKVEDAADTDAWSGLSDDPWGLNACVIKKREKVSTRLVVQGPPTKDSFWRAGEIPLVGGKMKKKRTFVTKDGGNTRVNITNNMQELGRLRDLQRDRKKYDTPQGVIILYYDDDDVHSDVHSDDDDPYSDEEFFTCPY
ncbi:uncharacterized protein EDB91DRAFT_1088484 [Suillus paluster]|uniref:uncharacterized protein n=1 Tax=Suillus paluster TaxID=48578 RepID=UPI001B868320|nr:uncharacterized protein EDB91DRAFT_1088484 [Suillus paluster]KAG1721309.1 hypothetical protein EDB91DRAFT_1088484 [Suillus paluster]